MSLSRFSPFARNDTPFGICEALGEDLGFNPFPLRATFAGLLLWNPALVLGTYAALGVIVVTAHLLCPSPSPAARPQVVETEEKKEEAQLELLPIAA